MFQNKQSPTRVLKRGGLGEHEAGGLSAQWASRIDPSGSLSGVHPSLPALLALHVSEQTVTDAGLETRRARRTRRWWALRSVGLTNRSERITKRNTSIPPGPPGPPCFRTNSHRRGS